MLTDLRIKTLPLPEKRREYPDGKIAGLYLIAQSSGLKSWCVRYRARGLSRKLTLGPYPALGLAEARRGALEALGAIAAGKDPAAAKQASKAAARAEKEEEYDLVERVVPLFIERHAKVRNRDWRETQTILSREVVGRWKGRRLSRITRAQVHEALDEIADRAPIRANRTLAAFRKLCNWSVERGIIERSPCDKIKAPSPERSRDRVLSDGELSLIWQAFDAIGFPFGQIGKLLLLTGQRVGEVSGARWAEIDLAAKSWTIPATRAKNGRANLVPLSAAAIEVLEGLPRFEGSDFVFTTTGSTAVSGFSRAKRQIDRTVLQLGVVPPAPWRLHDLRRTVATNLQRLGVRLEVTEAVLNHASGSRAGIVGVYQRHTWAAEKRQALDAWARRLAEIVGGERASNVVELAQSRSR